MLDFPTVAGKISERYRTYIKKGQPFYNWWYMVDSLDKLCT